MTAIQNEIKILKKLRHRHIIQFYRIHHEDGRLFLIMDLAERGSLADAILGNSLHDNNSNDNDKNGWSTKARIAHEIARGLEYIHQESVVHRDLKSANVLLTRHMEVKLADFGLAQVKSMSSASKSSTAAGIAGTLRWIAPELFDKPVYSTKSDVYALGVVMWEMAANCTRPFKDQDNEALVVLSVKNGHREKLPDNTPEEYRSWVIRCWDHDPAKRPKASGIVLVEEAEPTKEEAGWHHAPTLSFDLSLDGSTPATKDKDCLEDKLKNMSVEFLSSVASHNRSGAVGEKVDGTDSASQPVSGSHDPRSSTRDDPILWYLKAAEQGHADAQNNLGMAFLRGKGVQQSYVEAVKWLRMAGVQGHSNAQATLGSIYLMGSGDRHGVKQSDANAALWTLRAAEQGHANAQLNIGYMYYHGREFIQDYATAASWYCRAAEQGSAEAQASLALMYERGQGVEQSFAEALRWYRQAAEFGDKQSQYHLGAMYTNGQGGVKQNFPEGAMWYRRAAEQGHAKAQNNLGTLYEHGQGIKQNFDEAALLYRQAAEQGEAQAQANLGSLYLLGHGVQQSFDEAALWLSRAAHQSHPRAQYDLGLMHWNGDGVDRNLGVALSWIRKAANQGDPEAQSRLGDLLQMAATTS